MKWFNSFLDGIARILDIGCTYHKPTHKIKTIEECRAQDLKNLQHDWDMVVKDFEKVLKNNE